MSSIRHAHPEHVQLEAVLRKYIRYVQEVEGADFITEFEPSRTVVGHSDVKFTPEEWALLERLSREVNGGR